MTQKRYQKAVNIKDLLNTSELAKIMKKGLFINELNQKLEKRFPPQFKGLYRLANFTENSLNIEVTNAMVRQGLLFHQNELLQYVQQDMPEITQLKFIINPELNKTN
ncbi:DciA family protein [Lonepinella sp. MS14437]|uniref:DciA family protein n=1 Tax=Lonepinella sp. MS14437 TaxID=3003620 RepID=UPI0036DCA356